MNSLEFASYRGRRIRKDAVMLHLAEVDGLWLERKLPRALVRNLSIPLQDRATQTKFGCHPRPSRSPSRPSKRLCGVGRVSLSSEMGRSL